VHVSFLSFFCASSSIYCSYLPNVTFVYWNHNACSLYYFYLGINFEYRVAQNKIRQIPVRFREVSGLSSFKNFKNRTTGCKDIAYSPVGYFILSHPVDSFTLLEFCRLFILCRMLFACVLRECVSADWLAYSHHAAVSDRSAADRDGVQYPLSAISHLLRFRIPATHVSRSRDPDVVSVRRAECFRTQRQRTYDYSCWLALPRTAGCNVRNNIFPSALCGCH